MGPAKRLAKELAAIEKDTSGIVTVEVAEDITRWTVKMKGPESSPYAAGTFLLSFDFKNYPFKAPDIVFLTRVYHPNVKTDTGEICAGILADNWAPTLNAMHCVNVLRNMLAEPNLESPLETNIAVQYRENKKDFDKTAMKYTKDYATAK
mmetsp:Transcript_29251/g.42948  ORF Transcript_29251/g.42948 Transcript_29251/m.42948 type:complete len:150 (-) Transcript_29251:345-794(-)|eukprot:CAMPEP_0116020312 /NCGR_PEP_ID=MMETSP0321-20121206/9723_1 /TAXON_ID=163516 /ORGANISM="Leptocylindrus danicus var. danicus, Strain B650" /LENGTH=149 /DNA_ID=CAMNT_0003490981 /DNA_START=153 /DNA_END=602 /DNA_ORIENTATION=+